jgi:hypothetical protein
MRSRAHKLLLAAAGVGLLLASASCSKSEGVSRGRAVDDAAARFHEHLKGLEFDEIYDEASYGLRAKVRKEAFVERLRAVRARLGDIALVQEAHYSDRQYDEEHDFVSTSFDVDGSAEDFHELMFWDVSGSEARLLRYGGMFKDSESFINLTN